MKVMKVQVPNLIKNVAVTMPLLFAIQSVVAYNSLQKDVFEKRPNESIEYFEGKNAVSPAVKIAGKQVYPALVVDLSDERLYKYDLNGVLIDSYPIKFVKNKIKSGVNLINITKHRYSKDNIVDKILLTPLNKTNGKPAEAPEQVICGTKDSKLKKASIYTNVILVEKKSASKVAEFLTEDQYVLIRK